MKFAGVHRRIGGHLTAESDEEGNDGMGEVDQKRSGSGEIGGGWKRPEFHGKDRRGR